MGCRGRGEEVGWGSVGSEGVKGGSGGGGGKEMRVRGVWKGYLREGIFAEVWPRSENWIQNEETPWKENPDTTVLISWSRN